MNPYFPKQLRNLLHKSALAIATVIVLGSGIAGQAAAATSKEAALKPTEEDAVRKVGSYFNTLKTLEGEFVQVGPRGHISSGKFYLSKPGRLRFEYAPPNPFLIVTDGTWLVVNNRKKNKADYYPLSQTPLRLVLSEKVNLLTEAKILHVRASKETISLTLEDRDQLVPGQLTVVYDNKKKHLKQWVIIDGQGLRTTISLKSLQNGVDVDPALFKVKLRKEIKDREGR